MEEKKLFYGCNLSVYIHRVKELSIEAKNSPGTGEVVTILFRTTEDEDGEFNFFFEDKPKIKGIKMLNKLKNIKTSITGIFLQKKRGKK